MTTEPAIVERAATPYAAITANVTMEEIAAVVPPLTQQVFAWLGAQRIEPVGAPFWKYNVIDMERGLEIEAGVPTADPVNGEAPVHGGVLPAGRYVTMINIGHPQTLMDATRRLLEWADGQGLDWDVSSSPDGDRWGCRLEIYHDEPGQDMNEWQTELAFRLAD